MYNHELGAASPGMGRGARFSCTDKPHHLGPSTGGELNALALLCHFFRSGLPIAPRLREGQGRLLDSPGGIMPARAT